MTSNSITVAIIEPVGGHGGCNYYDFSLCRSIVKARGRPILYTCDKTIVRGDEGFKILCNYKGIYGQSPAWLRGLRFVFGSIKSLIGARFEGAKIAHFHFYHVGPLELFNVLLAKLLAFRVVITAHDVEAFKKNLSVPIFVHWAYYLASRVIAHNYVSRDELLSTLGVPSDKVEVIPHGNHLEYVIPEITRLIARQRFGFIDTDRVIVFFGQIKEVKGLDVLIEAFALAKKEDSSLKLIIAGKVWKDDFSKYENLIIKHRLKDHTNLQIRYIPDEEVPYFYQCADLIALPYNKIYQSGVVLMAMSYARPVIVSDIPGMLEVVEDNKSGFVFRCGDSEHMAARIKDCFSTPGLLDVVSKGGFKRISEDYDWEEIGRKTVACYLDV